MRKDNLYYLIQSSNSKWILHTNKHNKFLIKHEMKSVWYRSRWIRRRWTPPYRCSGTIPACSCTRRSGYSCVPPSSTRPHLQRCRNSLKPHSGLTLTWRSSALVTHRCTWSRRPPSRRGSGTWSSPGRWRRRRACRSYERWSHTRRYLMQNKHFRAAAFFLWVWTRFLRNPGYLCIQWSPSWRSILADSGRWRSLSCFHSRRADRC